jgi:prepilin-type N-terminal cleavage/methylation domain-containing protein
MVQYNKNIKNKKKGFTLVELMVVLAITAILAALVGGGLIAYTRLARFERTRPTPARCSRRRRSP